MTNEERAKQSCYLLPPDMKRDLMAIAMVRTTKAGKRVSDAEIVREALTEKIAKERRKGNIV